MNLLYGNNIGMSAKKSSSYSSSLIARVASLASGGFREGGNLPFCSHDSVANPSAMTAYSISDFYTLCYQFLDALDSDLQLGMEHCLQGGELDQIMEVWRCQRTHLVNDLLPFATL